MMDPPSSHSDSSHPQIPQFNDIRHSLHSTRLEIESVRKRINLTLEEIEKAKVVLGELRATEVVLQGSAETMARLLSPFGRAPADILGNIAEHVTSSESTTSSFWKENDIVPLTHVCSSWRNAMLSFPHLWSSLNIDGRLTHCPGMLSTFLERSKSHPLSFSMAYASYSESLTATMQILVKHSERWKSADVSTSIGPTTLTELHKRLPSLESLTLTIDTPPPLDPWLNSGAEQRIFEDAPRLTRLEFVYRTLLPVTNPVPFKFPIHQLRDFITPWHPDIPQLGRWDVEHVSHFQRLQSLRINARSPAWSAARSSNTFAQRIQLPILKHFSLCMANNDCSLSLFGLPSLTRLDILDLSVQRENLAGFQTFLGTIRRGQLKEVRLTLSKRCEDAYVEALLIHPSFEHVWSLSLTQDRQIKKMFWVKSIMSRATFRPPYTYIAGEKPPILFPFLRDFTLYFSAPGRIGVFRALEEFLTSRTHLVDTMLEEGGHDGGDQSHLLPTRLRKVFIRCSRSLQPITLENYRCLRDGMLQFKD